MDLDFKSIPRKKFLVWGMAILSLFTLIGVKFWPKKRPKTVVMLTEDGKLVEVDASLLPSKRRKISNQELQSWVKK